MEWDIDQQSVDAFHEAVNEIKYGKIINELTCVINDYESVLNAMLNVEIIFYPALVFINEC